MFILGFIKLHFPYIITIPKIFYFLLLAKFAFLYFPQDAYIIYFFNFWVAFFGMLSIFVGTLAGLVQKSFLRLIAYSSINNMGFVLLGFINISALSLTYVMIYLLNYFILTINVFSVYFSFRSLKDGNFLLHGVGDLALLVKAKFFVGVGLALTFFSNLGLPPLAGFFSKLLILLHLIDNQYFFVLFFVLVSSGIASFFYLRLVKAMFFKSISAFPFSAPFPYSLSFIFWITVFYNVTFIFFFDFIFDFFYGFSEEFLSYRSSFTSISPEDAEFLREVLLNKHD